MLLWAARVEAGSVTLVWDRSPDPEVAGYSLAYGTQPGRYSWWVDVGGATSFTVNALPDGTYYFAVRAYANDGSVSDYSNEVVAMVLAGNTTLKSSGCTTADPFASIGGGTCYNGGWLPPGMSIPSGLTATTSAPAPSTSTSSGCKTADPFAALGGGTCYKGNWLPPGMPIPGGTSAPAPSAPIAAPASVQGCSTADPFATLGGGTCYNGGWLPPGMAPPSGAVAQSPAPVSSGGATQATGCASADPFATLGGGTCYRGGWLPPGFALTVTGTLRVIDMGAGTWMVEASDGTIFTSPTKLKPEQLLDGASVKLHGAVLPSGGSTGRSVAVDLLLLEFTR